MDHDRLSGAYRYEYRMTFRFGHWRHSYELVGRHGAVNFHVTDIGDDAERNDLQRYSAGIEYHYRTPPEYMNDQPPSHDECWLLKAPCWHDGTSLYAQEHLLPVFLRGDHVAMLRRLADDADEHFGAKAEQRSAE